MCGDMRKQLADRNPALSVILKFPGAGEGGTDIVELGRFNLHPKRFSVLCRQPWFGIPTIHLRRSAIHVQVDDALDLWGKMGRTAGKDAPPPLLFPCQSLVVCEQSAKRQGTESVGAGS